MQSLDYLVSYVGFFEESFFLWYTLDNYQKDTIAHVGSLGKLCKDILDRWTSFCLRCDSVSWFLHTFSLALGTANPPCILSSCLGSVNNIVVKEFTYILLLFMCDIVVRKNTGSGEDPWVEKFFLLWKIFRSFRGYKLSETESRPGKSWKS